MGKGMQTAAIAKKEDILSATDVASEQAQQETGDKSK